MKRSRLILSIIAVLLIACILCGTASTMPTHSDMVLWFDSSPVVCEFKGEMEVVSPCDAQNNSNHFDTGINAEQLPTSTNVNCHNANRPESAGFFPFPVTFILRNLGSNIRRRLRKCRSI